MDEVPLLRSYLIELRQDEAFLSLLRSAGVGGDRGDTVTEDIAQGWLDDVELDTGLRVPAGAQSQIFKFVENRYPALVVRFRGNTDAARLTMLNLLDARFRRLTK